MRKNNIWERHSQNIDNDDTNAIAKLFVSHLLVDLHIPKHIHIVHSISVCFECMRHKCFFTMCILYVVSFCVSNFDCHTDRALSLSVFDRLVAYYE